ncbi:hypothetical protein ABWL39_19100, partial [Chitinivorax sp. PXF-14]|uniref:hypothetical protein n=1 Tax=Chitinivorax sp. PXF-14 TaxID=3230488 RepID=UPI003465B999
MVGYLADVLQEDPEFADEFVDRLKVLEDCLARHGVVGYSEPAELLEDAWFSCQMFGYSGLHHLRRLAAHVAFNEPIYEPSRELPAQDPIVDCYYAAVGNGDISDLPFQHLMLHGHSEGFYVPVDSPRVIDPGELFEVVGGGIGSAIRLLAECKALAAILELPESTDPEAREVWDAADAPGVGPARWQRFGIESFSCIKLIWACKRAVDTGAAVVFC